MQILERPALEAVFEAAPARQAIARGLIALAAGRAISPAPIGLAFPDQNGECHVKAGTITGFSRFVVKIATGFYDNPRHGLSSSNGALLLFCARTGAPLALLLDNGFITDRRTALTGAMASKALARRDSRTIGILGTGTQARWQLFDHARDWPEARFLIWGRTPARALELAGIAQAAGLRAEATADREDLCRRADILITTTPATAPLFEAGWIRGGAHITAVGSDSPDKQELPVALLASAALIVADERANALRNGECRAALHAGAIAPDAIVELGTILESGAPERRESDITIADLTGVAVQDLALATFLFDRASPAGHERSGGGESPDRGQT